MSRESRRWGWMLVPAVGLVGACHGGSGAGRPVEQASEVIAGLQTRTASPLPQARASRFETVDRGFEPRFGTGDERVSARVVLPARASDPVHLEEVMTGVAIDVTLAGASSATGQVLGGYLAFPGAHPSGASLIHRPLPSGTEDYLSFESPPAVPEVDYNLALGNGASGLRLVANTLEMVDASGAPRLRVAPPYVVGADGARTDATLAVSGCAVDTNPAGPWGRAVTPPGAPTCKIRVTWPKIGIVYPAVLDPRWTTTGSMTTPRQGHTATLLSTGNVLVVGGTSDGSTALASAELYNRTSGTWAATGSMTGVRTLHTATQLNTSSNGTTSGKVLIAGGLNGSISQNTAQLYSPSTGTWTAATSLNAARHSHTATLLADGRVLVTGGLNGTTTLNTAAIYNPAAGPGSWTATTGPLPSALKNHAAALLTTGNAQLSNKVLVFGGNNGSTTGSAVYLFNPTQGAFTTLTSLPNPREGHTVTVLPNGNLLVTGGKNGATSLATAILFNPSSGMGSWSPAGTMTVARQAHSATLIAANGQVLVAGGSNGSSTLSSAELWNGTTIWTATTALISPQQGHTATPLGNDAVLLTGGVDGATTVSTAQVYDALFGTSCTSGSQCTTGFCVDGVCCNSACNGGCGACNLAGTIGICSPIATGTLCRPAAGACDVAETCNGTSLSCPADVLEPSGTVCRTAAGVCDVTETCNGTSATCPTDGFVPAGTVCRASAGVCDAVETCSGASATCPANSFLASTTVCRPAVNLCDLAENCTGTSASCPADGFVVCQAPDQCHTGSTTCDPAVGCPLAAKPDGSACNDNNACTQIDTCQAGRCVGGNPVQCPASDGCHQPSTCNPSNGICTAPPVADGTCQLGVFEYDKAGRLVQDRQAALTYDGYDQLRTVTPIATMPVPANVPVEEIGDIDGAFANAFLAVRAINAKGHATGWATLPNGQTHAYMYVGSGTSIDINDAAGNIPTELDGYGITSNDTVGGGYFDATGTQHLFTYSQAQGFADLGTGPPGTLVNPQDLNDAGQFVGTLNLASGVSHAFRFTPGVGYDDIGTLGGQNSFGFGIDGEGTVFGSAQTPDSPSSGFEFFGHAAIYNSEVGLVDLNQYVDPMSGLVLVTTFRSAGNWISGTAVQDGINSGYRLNVVTGMVDDIAVTNGGSLFGFGINSYGEVVGDGTIDGPGNPSAAYIFTDQLGLRKLNDLIDPSSGWNLTNALGIDDNGDVVGTGYLNGRFAAYILRLPLRPVGGGAPTVAVAHSYGYDGLRTSTTNGPGTGGATVQFWFTQDYTQHDGVRDHYVRIGDRIIAKVTYDPSPGGMGAGLVRGPEDKPTDSGDLFAKIVLALLLAGGLAASGGGLIGKKRRPTWVTATAGPMVLFFVASCEMMGLNSRQSAATLWQRVETVYFHQGIAAGPVLTGNSDGTVREERRYEAFGQPIDAYVGGSIGPVDFRREQQNSLGKITDPATGWSYHGARWMQPQTARWTTPDSLDKGPISAALSAPWELNPYSYGLQNPAQFWDPDGSLAWIIPEHSGQTGPMGRWTTEVRFEVQQGDTRETIAKQLLVSPDRIAVEHTDAIANKVALKPGDTITVLGPPARLRVAANALTHVGSTDFKAVEGVYHCNTEVISAMKESGLRSPGWTAGQFGDSEGVQKVDGMHGAVDAGACLTGPHTQAI